MPRPSKHLPRDHDGSTKRVRLRARLTKLRRDRVIIDREIKKLEKLWGSVRPFHKCQRCGYEWRGMNPENIPQNCARCHSAGWNSPVKNPQRARKPSDAANPNWGQPYRLPRSKRLVEEPQPLVAYVPPMVVDYEEIGKASQAATEEILRRALHAPEGLPAPPIIGIDLGFEPPIAVVMPAPPSLMPSAPVLYRPRQPEQEPQPESLAMPVPPVVESAPTPDDLELMFPPIALDLRIAADRGEEAWEAYVEESD